MTGIGQQISEEAAHRQELTLIRARSQSANIGRIVWTITVFSGAIAFIIVASVTFIALFSVWKGTEIKIPEVLVNWGGVILGFYFGQFVTLLKEANTVEQPSPNAGEASTAEQLSPTAGGEPASKRPII